MCSGVHNHRDYEVVQAMSAVSPKDIRMKEFLLKILECNNFSERSHNEGMMCVCRGVDNHGDYEVVQALGERVDTLVKEDVLLLKVDVEGLEPAVLHSATRLFDKYT